MLILENIQFRESTTLVKERYTIAQSVKTRPPKSETEFSVSYKSFYLNKTYSLEGERNISDANRVARLQFVKFLERIFSYCKAGNGVADKITLHSENEIITGSVVLRFPHEDNYIITIPLEGILDVGLAMQEAYDLLCTVIDLIIKNMTSSLRLPSFGSSTFEN